MCMEIKSDLDGTGVLQKGSQLALLVEGCGFVASADAFASDEDPGHAPSSSDLLHVVLDLIAVIPILNLQDLNILGGNVVLLQDFLRTYVY